MSRLHIYEFNEAYLFLLHLLLHVTEEKDGFWKQDIIPYIDSIDQW